MECKTSLEEGTYEPLKLISQQVQPNCLATGSVGDLVSRHKAENNLQSSKTPEIHRWPAYAHSCKHTSIHMYTHLCAHAHTLIHNKNGSPSSFTKMSEHRTSSPSPLSAESAQPGQPASSDWTSQASEAMNIQLQTALMSGLLQTTTAGGLEALSVLFKA